MAPKKPTKKPAKKQPATPAYERRTVADDADPWFAISSIAVAPDGRTFAGENGGYRICGWDPSGAQQWTASLAKRGKDSRYNYETGVQLVGDTLVASGGYRSELWLVDPATGKCREKRALPKLARVVKVSPDGTRLVARIGTGTVVLAFPSLEPIASFDHYCNLNHIAISPDGTWFAVNGDEVHVYDLANAAYVTTFAPPSGPWAIAFTPTNELVIGDESSQLALHDPATGKQLAVVDGAADKKRKPTITTLAATGDRIAAGRDDGTVAVFDGKLRPIRTFDRHVVIQPDTSSTSLDCVELSADAKRLYVGAARKKDPVGITIYTL